MFTREAQSWSPTAFESGTLIGSTQPLDVADRFVRNTAGIIQNRNRALCPAKSQEPCVVVDFRATLRLILAELRKLQAVAIIPCSRFFAGKGGAAFDHPPVLKGRDWRLDSLRNHPAGEDSLDYRFRVVRARAQPEELHTWVYVLTGGDHRETPLIYPAAVRRCNAASHLN